MELKRLAASLRIRAGVDGLLVLVTLGFVVIVGGFFALQRHHLGVLRLGDLIGGVRIDEADDEIDEPHLAGLDGFIVPQQQVVGAGVAAERDLDGLQALFDALRDANFALARQQFHGAHFAHVHAHGIGGAPEFGVQIGERGGRLFHRFFVGSGGGIGEQQRLGVRRLFVHRNTHVIDHVDDVFDLLRIDDFAREMIVDFSVGEVALLLAARNQQFQLRLTLVSDLSRCACWRFFDQGGRLVEDLDIKMQADKYTIPAIP